MSRQKTETEVLEIQAKVLKAFLDGMDCYLYVDSDGTIMLDSKTTNLDSGVPVIQED